MPKYEINLIKPNFHGEQTIFIGPESEAIAKMHRMFSARFCEANVFELRGNKRIHIKTEVRG